MTRQTEWCEGSMGGEGVVWEQTHAPCLDFAGKRVKECALQHQHRVFLLQKVDP